MAGKTILIVEDNPLNMKLLRDVLEVHGYETIATGEGGEALTLAREHQPDLILMDLQLPDISGFDAVRHLKDHAPTRTTNSSRWSNGSSGGREGRGSGLPATVAAE